MGESDEDLADQELRETPHRELWAQLPSALELLLDQGADAAATDNPGQNTLHHLLKKKDVERTVCETRRNFVIVIQQANKCPGIVKQKDSVGSTPLHLALENGHFWAVDVLLAHGADTRVPNLEGNTPVHFVASWLRIAKQHPVSSHIFSLRVSTPIRMTKAL